MNSKIRHRRKYLVLPDIYSKSFTSKSVKTITIEEILQLIIIIQSEDSTITAKDVLKSFIITQITLAWGAQVFLNAKFSSDNSIKHMSKEKMFQQTISHGIYNKILSHSIEGKIMTSVPSVLTAIKRNFYKIDEEEAASATKTKLAINSDINNLIENKGSGTTKISVRNPESRLTWLKGQASSYRSTWGSTPVFSPSSLAQGMEVKNLDEQDIMEYYEELTTSLINGGIITEEDAPSWQDISSAITKIMSEIVKEVMIDDGNSGTFPSIPLDLLLGVQRNTIQRKAITVTNPLLDKLMGIKPKDKGNETISELINLDTQEIEKKKPKSKAKAKKAKPKTTKKKI